MSCTIKVRDMAICLDLVCKPNLRMINNLDIPIGFNYCINLRKFEIIKA